MHTEQDTQDIFFQKVEIKENVMIDGQKFFDQPLKNDMKTCGKIREITTGQRDDHSISCLQED